MSGSGPRPTLFWTVNRCAGSYDVMRVTTDGDNGLYGSIDNMPTHCKRDQVHGRFTSKDAAHKLCQVLRTHHANFSFRLNEARNALTRIEAQEIEERHRILRGYSNADA